MPEIEHTMVFMLVIVRFSGLILTAPILSSANFPIVAKIGLIGLSAILMTPSVVMMDHPVATEPLAFAIAGAGELLIGMVMGLVMTMVFGAIQIGGQVMDMQSGFGLMNVFNPALETQFPIFGFFYFILAVLYLLVINGPHIMIMGLAHSFEVVPLGGFAPDADLMWVVSSWGTVMFLDGILIAAPVAGAMMLAYVTMGLMGRVVPQIHLFIVGFPLAIALGLVIVAFSVDLYVHFLDGMFYDMFRRVEYTVEGLG